MSVGHITQTQVGDLIGRHVRSLPRYHTATDREQWWPSILLFVAVPAAGAAALVVAGIAPISDVVGGLLAGVGVLSGFLFQVLAWVGSRIATIADVDTDRPLTSHERQLVGRLDLARANIAYAALVSIVFAMQLGIVALLTDPPTALTVVSAFLLLHLGLTLLLVLLRINSIAKDDRVAAITRHARTGDR
jgi:hypothetical protein